MIELKNGTELAAMIEENKEKTVLLISGDLDLFNGFYPNAKSHTAILVSVDGSYKGYLFI
jgi:hypothetical protein